MSKRKITWVNLFLVALLVFSAASQGIGAKTADAADGTVLYVKVDGDGDEDGSSWGNAFATLQEALEEADEGTDIWIAKGTYYPTKEIEAGDARTKTFQMKNGVAIYGGFEGNENPENFNLDGRNFTTNETILSGDLGTPDDDSDNAYHVFYHPNDTELDATAILDGVTITGGNANKSANVADENSGGGMYNKTSDPTLNNVKVIKNNAINGGGVYNDESSPTLSNVEIAENSSSHGGGIMNISSSPTLSKVKINQNKASGDSGGGGGMMNLTASSPILTNVEINGNEATGQYATGGGMYNDKSNPTLTNMTISNNSADGGEGGGGMLNILDSDPTLTYVEIKNNEATGTNGVGGGMASIKSGVTLNQVEIIENEAVGAGGGMYNEVSNPTLTNVTISRNMSSKEGGGIYNYDSNPTINNSIIWGNDLSIKNKDDKVPDISYSLIGGSGGSANWNADFGIDSGNNVDADPLFVDAANGNYQLAKGSPAINKGSNALLPARVTTDLAGNPRIDNGTVDMGAYEYKTPPPGSGGGSGIVKSNNADLQELKITADSTLHLSPTFSASTLAYTAETEASEVELSIKSAHSAAKVFYDDKEIGTSLKVELKEGDNVLEFIVEAENGTKKTYTVTVQRKASAGPVDPTDPGMPSTPVEFTDISNHWAKNQIIEATERKFINGYGDGTFRPDANITRAEFTIILANAFGLTGEGVTLPFKDNRNIGPSSRQAVAQAYEAGIISGFTDGTFRPAAKISRMEIAVMIARALELETSSTQTGFADDDSIRASAKDEIEALRKTGIIQGRSGNKFDAQAKATRAETIVMILRMVEWQEN